MKSPRLAILALSCLMALPAAGQQSNKSSFTIMGGMTMFKLSQSGTGAVTLDNATGFMGGIGMIKPVSGPVGLEIDAAYVQKGAASTASGVTYTTHENFAEGMVMLRPVFGTGEAKFFLLGGGEVGYYVSCAYAGGTVTTSCTIASGDKRTDYGLVFGGGVQFNKLAVQVRYDLGLANLSTSTVSGFTAKNQGIMIMGSFIM